jgi:hypothetical protein
MLTRRWTDVTTRECFQTTRAFAAAAATTTSERSQNAHL